MKKSLILISFLLIVSIVSAGEMITIDFTKTPVVVEEINEGDALRFTINGKTHELLLKEVYESKNYIKAALFVEGAETPAYLSIYYNQKVLIDFYKDGTNDLAIVLESVSNNKARIILRILDETGNPVLESTNVSNAITGNVVADEGSSVDAKTGLLITGAIVIIGFVIALIIIKK
ncbi:hypothetical protein J4413_04165 [Candidatus Woesearchaeota archaeon]|nr:hypothetical protein [Candidatus Woesearchaeota archaeon]